MGIDPTTFNQIWDAIGEQNETLEQRVARLERKMSRAEVAGAVEAVAALPDPGHIGRLLYVNQAEGNLFLDRGTAFVPLVNAPLGVTVYRNEGTVNWSTASLTFEEVWPGDYYLDITPSTSRVFIHSLTHFSVSTNAGLHTLLVDGVNVGGDVFGLGYIEAGMIMLFPALALVQGLTPHQTYRITVGARASNVSYPVASIRYRTNFMVAWEA